jgi:hypothetical protein
MQQSRLAAYAFSQLVSCAADAACMLVKIDGFPFAAELEPRFRQARPLSERAGFAAVKLVSGTLFKGGHILLSEAYRRDGLVRCDA